jgi:hypothetical protein
MASRRNRSCAQVGERFSAQVMHKGVVDSSILRPITSPSIVGDWVPSKINLEVILSCLNAYKLVNSEKFCDLRCQLNVPDAKLVGTPGGCQLTLHLGIPKVLIRKGVKLYRFCLVNTVTCRLVVRVHFQEEAYWLRILFRKFLSAGGCGEGTWAHLRWIVWRDLS